MLTDPLHPLGHKRYTMYARIFKDSAAAKKAWLTRARNAAARQKALEESQSAKAPLKASPAPKVAPAKGKMSKVQAKAMTTYMDGFTSKLKNPQEKAYAERRANELILGKERESGMSAQYGMTKQRAAQYEGLIYKIFKAGKVKHNVA